MMRQFPVLLLLFSLAACTEQPQMPPEPRPIVSEIIGAQSGSRNSYIGSIAPRTETDLGFPVSGILKMRPVQVGDVVKQGDLLGQIDPVELDAALRVAKAGVGVATARLHSAQDATDRVENLLKKGVDSIAKAEETRASLEAAKATLTQSQTALNQAIHNRGFADLPAPHEGVITQVYAEPGAALTAGHPVARLATIGEREAIVDLSEQDIAGLVPGEKFRVWLEIAPSISTNARLRLIDPVADTSTRTRRLHLSLDGGAPDAFRLGALVRAERTDRPQVQQMTLPVTAIIDGQTPAVWVVSGDERQAKRIVVTLGQRNGGRVAVASGLVDGQEVIVKGVHSIQEGQKVGPHIEE